MNRSTSLALVIALLFAAVSGGGHAAAAPTPTSYANGAVRTTGASADFAAVLDAAQEPYFELWDYASGQTRDIILTQVTEATCLGEMFGGQAISLSGYAWDSTTNQSGLPIQVFLVDGGDTAPDRLSVKVRRTDERVVYFLPMRALTGGDVWVSCGA
jgi:hypothetical protein